jgi:hypothetical protein
METEKQKISVHVQKPMNQSLKYLKENNDQDFLGRLNNGKNQKRLIDMIFLGAARTISLKQSYQHFPRSKKTHDHIIQDLEKDLSDSSEIIFISQLISYYVNIKAMKDDPHHIIFDKQTCMDIIRSYFEIGWNLGTPSFQEIIEDPISPQNKIIAEIFDLFVDESINH